MRVLNQWKPPDPGELENVNKVTHMYEDIFINSPEGAANHLPEYFVLNYKPVKKRNSFYTSRLLFIKKPTLQSGMKRAKKKKSLKKLKDVFTCHVSKNLNSPQN